MKTAKKIVGIIVVLGLALPYWSLADTSTRTLSGVLKGKKKKITFTVDSNIYNYIYNIPRVPCPTCTSLAERDRVIITEETQKAALAPLVAAIKKKAKKKADQARIAVSLVQNIPYDDDKNALIKSGHSTHLRYPYEAIYDNLQICSESSYLVAFLLSELGYAAGVFVFPDASHDTAAVKCPMKYSYKGTGYCFIEATGREIITYDTMANRYSGDYIFEELAPNGSEFSPKKDYKDASNLRNYETKLVAGKLGKKSRKKYKKIIKNYGL